MASADQTRKTASGDSSVAASGDSGRAASGDIASRLLDWYDLHHRELPWRITPIEHARGARPDPYRIWLSEVMLQQTTVEAVKAYFRVFVEKWPDVEALAAAPTEDVMKAWAGLGYYSRARNLKACADLVAQRGGRFPDTEAALRELPGIGAYTSAAITAIAFDRPAAVVDGNVERVISRLFSITTPLSEAKPEIRAHVERMVPGTRPGDFAQAMMDLGATICTPRRPRCMLCPLREDCSAVLSGDPEHFPVRLPKADKPLRRGAAFVAVRDDGAILLRKRAEKGLLGGMTEVPTTGWTARIDGATTEAAAPFPANWRHAGRIAHVFTHFALELEVFHAHIKGDAPAGHFWSLAHEISGEALPTVMKKAIEAAIPGATKKPSPHSAKSPMTEIRHIVFDIGRVLIHYDPNIPFSRLIPDAEERKWFFDNVCTHDWNIEQDRGRTWEEAEALLIADHPDHAENIRSFRRHWREMVPHAYEDSVAIMVGLIESGHDVTMLTNFASDTLAEARERFDFLERPRGVTVSADIRQIKPDRAIYDHHVAAFGLEPSATLFIDDSQKNVDGAKAAGWQSVLFTDAKTLQADLERYGIKA